MTKAVATCVGVWLAVAPMAVKAQETEAAATELQMGAENAVTFNLLNFIGLAGATYIIDLNYIRTISPQMAVHVNPVVSFGTLQGLGAEAGLRFYPFGGAQQGLFIGPKVGGGWNGSQLGGFSNTTVHLQFQLGYELVLPMSPVAPGEYAKSGFVLDFAGSLGGAYNNITSSVGNSSGIGLGLGLRVGVGYAF